MNSIARSASPTSSSNSSKPKVSRSLWPSLAAQNVSAPKQAQVKKLIPSIDTKLNSYDRTDPFFAFNTLIKLLGLLPSRIGGCQFKLTPNEHRLSLHLLTIVEPFLGLEPSRRSITRQPTEVLDSIIFHVDSKRDLLSLSLSCRRMHDVIFPRHFQYRVIKCKVSSISIWNHLIVNRALAKNVRKLEILDERSPVSLLVPSGILISDTDLESTDDELGLHDKQERYLVSALTKMTALTSFSWSCNHSPISMDNMWPTLLKCHSLCHVDINDNLIFAAPPSDSSGSDTRPRVLPMMKTIAFRSTPHAYGATKLPNLERISGILNYCPSIKTLDIAYSPPRSLTTTRPSADDLLLYGRWPQLTSLTLTNVRCTSHTGFDSASTFLFAHLNLEVLHLDINAAVGSSRITLPHNSLPRLRELHANKEIANAVLGCPCDLPRPLEILKGFRLSGAQGGSRVTDTTFLYNLKQYNKSIKRIELNGWNELEDIRCLIESTPALTWLDVGKKGSGQAARDKSTAVATNLGEWATVLSELPYLTAFHGVKFFYEVSAQAAVPSVTATSTNISMTDRSRVRKNDEVAGVLAWKCGRLRRVDHWEEGTGKVIILVRDGERANDKDKVRWEVRRVKV